MTKKTDKIKSHISAFKCWKNIQITTTLVWIDSSLKKD